MHQNPCSWYMYTHIALVYHPAMLLHVYHSQHAFWYTKHNTTSLWYVCDSWYTSRVFPYFGMGFGIPNPIPAARSWAAQVLQCFSALDEPLPLVADAPIAIDIDLLQELFLRDRLASFDSLPQDPRLAPSAGVKLCTYHRWFGRPQNAACPSYWESPMGNAKLHRILRFRMGSHHLPVEEGRHFNLPRASRVCNLCNTDALGDERHMLLECPALADLRLQFSSLLLPCSGVMRRLLWAKDQHEVCRYIIACLDRMSSH